jgi:FolB domain-containing protein
MTDLPSDKIHIRDLSFRCIVGVNPSERDKKQDVVVNITLHANLAKACRSDALKDTVDYKALKQTVLGMAEESSFLLVEKLAQAIADICLSFDGVEAAQVVVDKPGALRYTRTVSVEIFRRRRRDG